MPPAGGPGGGTRTRDPMLPKHARFQLRYTRVFLLHSPALLCNGSSGQRPAVISFCL